MNDGFRCMLGTVCVCVRACLGPHLRWMLLSVTRWMLLSVTDEFDINSVRGLIRLVVISSGTRQTGLIDS